MCGQGPGHSEDKQLWCEAGVAEVGLGVAVGSAASIKVTFRSVCVVGAVQAARAWLCVSGSNLRAPKWAEEAVGAWG